MAAPPRASAAAEDEAPLRAVPGPLFTVGWRSSRLLSAAALAHGRPAAWLAAARAEAAPAAGALLSARNAPLLALVCVYSFFAAALISVASPFLPQELGAVGASPALVGLVFAAYPLTNLLLSPACTPACQRLGRCARTRPFLFCAPRHKGLHSSLFARALLRTRHARTHH
jgi:hypothetical protein